MVSEIVIAIFPFQNLSGNDDLDYLVKGFTEDLITDLSRFSMLQIISRHSTENINPENPDHALVKSFHANFFVKGSFRHGAGKIRINVQLLQAEDESLVWADRYDAALASIFDIQDEITETIVSSLQNHIDINILSSTRKKVTANLHAYEYWLKGLEALKSGTLDGDLKARQLFEKTLDIDPNYSRAYTGLSLSYFNEWSCRLWDLWETSQKGAYKYAQKAVELDELDYVALTVLGRVYLYEGAYEKAEHYLRKSLRLNPNDTDNLIQIASCLTFLGYPKESERLFLKAMRLNPVNKDWYYTYGAFIYFELGQFDRSIELGLKTPVESVWIDLPVYMAAAHFHTEQEEKMFHYWEIYLKLFQKKIIKDAEPILDEAIRWVKSINPFKKKTNLTPFLDFIGKKDGIKNPVVAKRSGIDHPTAMPRTESQNTFRKKGELWEISFANKAFQFPEVKGFQDLSVLLSQPGKEIHCAELMGVTLENKIDYFVLDDKSKNSYHKKIQDLRSEIEEAEQYHDHERTISLKEEYDRLVEHLSSSLGLAGKSRKATSNVERARSAVTWRIRSAIKKIGKVHPQLGLHLSKSIETGTFCAYIPENPVAWEL
jgi:TolB-like protein/Tfp pilus assembly protein PilF